MLFTSSGKERKTGTCALWIPTSARKPLYFRSCGSVVRKRKPFCYLPIFGLVFGTQTVVALLDRFGVSSTATVYLRSLVVIRHAKNRCSSSRPSPVCLGTANSVLPILRFGVRKRRPSTREFRFQTDCRRCTSLWGLAFPGPSQVLQVFFGHWPPAVGNFFVAARSCTRQTFRPVRFAVGIRDNKIVLVIVPHWPSHAFLAMSSALAGRRSRPPAIQRPAIRKHSGRIINMSSINSN